MTSVTDSLRPCFERPSAVGKRGGVSYWYFWNRCLIPWDIYLCSCVKSKKMESSEKEPVPASATTTATNYDDTPLKSRSSNIAVEKSPPSAASKDGPTTTKTTARRSKYRHVQAYHSKLRHSNLSRDSGTAASFLGFRNLMVIVLGMEQGYLAWSALRS